MKTSARVRRSYHEVELTRNGDRDGNENDANKADLVLSRLAGYPLQRRDSLNEWLKRELH